MTTIVGIKGKNGIVIGSDSQATGEIVKTLDVSKIFQINRNIGVGCAGRENHIKKLVREMEKRIKNNTKIKSCEDFRDELENIVIDLHRTNISEKSRRMGYRTNVDIFNVEAIAGIKSNNGFCLFSLNIQAGEVYEFEEYETIGSGSLFALLVLKQQERIVKPVYGSFSKMDSRLAIWTATLVINEVKNIETNTGGNTKIVLINNNGYQQIADEIVKEGYDKIINQTSEVFAEKLQDKKIEKIMKDFYPKS